MAMVRKWLPAFLVASAILALLLVGGCASPSGNAQVGGSQSNISAPKDAKPETARALEIRSLKAGRNAETRDETYELITSEHEWSKWWPARVHAPEVVVDWKQEMVFGAFLGGASPTDSIRVDKATASGQTIRLSVTVERREQSSTPTPAVIEYPFELVAIGRDGLPAGKYDVIVVNQNGQVLARFPKDIQVDQ